MREPRKFTVVGVVHHYTESPVLFKRFVIANNVGVIKRLEYADLQALDVYYTSLLM